MRILLKKAIIHHTGSALHKKQRDLLIVDGIIEKIAVKIEDDHAVVIKSKKLCVSPLWLDIGASSGEPGFEYRENLDSIRNAASKGGYGKIAVYPNTEPVVDNKAMIQQLLSANESHPVKFLPLAAATVGAIGKDLAEIIDLHYSGAVGFTDGIKTDISTDQLSRILQYSKVVNKPYLHVLTGDKMGEIGQVNEGKMSVSLGLEGIPKYYEEAEIKKLQAQMEYANYDKCIILGLSSAQSVKLISRPKKDLPIYASVPYLNMIFDEEDLLHFDVNLKLLPPLRSSSDRAELVKAFNNRQIRLVSSFHRPRSQEEKDEPFGLSAFGATGLEECFRALLSFAPAVDRDRLVEALSVSSYEALGLEVPKIEQSYPCSLTLFDMEESSSFDKTVTASRSTNTAFSSGRLKGKILGIIDGMDMILDN